MSRKKGKFRKDMRPIDVWGLALGAIIGWGCFVLPGSAFLPKAGPAGTAAGMLIGALLIIVIALSYGYMIRKFPVSGGEFIYAKEAIGKRNAFVCGWGMILAYWSLIPLNATALALISRYLFPGIVQQGLLYQIAGWDVYAGDHQHQRHQAGCMASDCHCAYIDRMYPGRDLPGHGFCGLVESRAWLP